MTITQAPKSWRKIRCAAKKMIQKLRACRHPNVEWCWTVEKDPTSDDEPHIHALVHSAPKLTEATLSEVASVTGFGPDVDLQRLRGFRTGATALHEASKAARYTLKEIVHEKVGTPQASDGLNRHLEANGDRLTHQSRGYFRSPEGESQGVYEATNGYRRSDDEWVVLASGPASEDVISCYLAGGEGHLAA